MNAFEIPSSSSPETFNEQKELRSNERYGTLNQEKFDRLLHLDFQEQLRDSPPFEGIFFPEQELAKVRNAPKEEKRGALTVFKEKLAKQREARAMCRTFIERSIEFNNDVSKEKLMELLERFADGYGFTEEQKQETGKLIDGYYENRRRVLKMRREYPDNTKLVNALTGMDFNTASKFEVIVGPMSFEIYTNGSDAKKIFHKSQNTVISFPFGGFAVQSQSEKLVMFIVMNMDDSPVFSSNLTDWKTRGHSILHEREHQKNRLFRKVFEQRADLGAEEKAFLEYESEPDPATKEALLEIYLTMARERFFSYVRDEIIAMKKEESPNFDKRLEIFFQQKEKSFL